ncbi:MAG: hypothetical protein HON14_02495 [Rhodospirillaceae bacterium]|jgi:hypothetical protein|nr:hypothetical protein [Rhodospirillaceae bacterium]MBT4937973.1 hypothetical protein [Rhodospirillaceae bacterium]MBT7267807.1 hypothetical protein [Rhodospirillaceae bacterium]
MLAYLNKLKLLLAVLLIGLISIEISLPQNHIELFSADATKEIADPKSVSDDGEDGKNAEKNEFTDSSLVSDSGNKKQNSGQSKFIQANTIILSHRPNGPPSAPS